MGMVSALIGLSHDIESVEIFLLFLNKIMEILTIVSVVSNLKENDENLRILTRIDHWFRFR